MKVRLLTGIAGVNFAFSPGATAEFPDDEARRLIEAGFAELVRDTSVETTIIARPPETTARRRRS